jgi:hypothetical protein
MTDQPSNTVPAPVCPWCSAALPDGGAAQCPSCGAALISEADESLPGLTAIDAGAIIRSRQTAIRPKSRLMSWLSGEDPDDVFTKAEGNALEPPEIDVRREMLRMELEAEVANLQAENEAALAEAAAEGRVVQLPPDLADAAESFVPTALAGAIATSDDGTSAEAPAGDAVAEPVAEAATPDVDAAPDPIADAALPTAEADTAEPAPEAPGPTDKASKKRR